MYERLSAFLTHQSQGRVEWNDKAMGVSLSQASRADDFDAEGLRVKLRAAVKKGKSIEKQRADLEAQLTALREQVPQSFSARHRHACSCQHRL